MNIDIATHLHDQLGEGPVWCRNENTLRWTDIIGKKWHILDLASGRVSSFDLDEGLTAFAPIDGSPNYLGALVSGIALLSPEGKRLNWLSQPEAGIETNRFNDGGSDPDGRFLAGTMNEADHAPTGNLYRVSPSHEVRCIRKSIGIFNTVAFSPCGTVFYTADTATGELAAFRYNREEGTLGERVKSFSPPKDLPGAPDGSAVDADGCLWNARWGGSCLVRLTPDGKLDKTLTLPVSQPTSCAFVDSTLYITSAAVGLDETALKQEPHAGALLKASPGVSGVPRPALNSQFDSTPPSPN